MHDRSGRDASDRDAHGREARRDRDASHEASKPTRWLPTVLRIAHAYCEAAGTLITADPKTQPKLVSAPRTAAAE